MCIFFKYYNVFEMIFFLSFDIFRLSDRLILAWTIFTLFYQAIPLLPLLYLLSIFVCQTCRQH